MRNINPFGLRMQPDLRAQIEEAAARNHRSLNAEIVARLEESLASESASEAHTEASGLRIEAEDGDEVRIVTQEQLYAIVDEAIQSVLGGAKGPARPTKGPTPRSKHLK